MMIKKDIDYLNYVYFKKFLVEMKKGYLLNQCNSLSKEIFDKRVLYFLSKPDGSLKCLLNYLYLLKRSNPNIIKKVLVLGAGSGRIGDFLEEKLCLKSFKHTLYELDSSDFIIKRLKNKFFKKNFRLPIKGDIKKLPFKKESIDLIIGYGVFRYVAEKKKAIDEINRVLNKDGICIIGEGKMKEVVEDIMFVLKKKKIQFNKKVYYRVKLPRLTFFYYLLKYGLTDDKLRRIIKKYMLKKQRNFVEACYNLAGNSKDKVFFISWRKF